MRLDLQMKRDFHRYRRLPPGLPPPVGIPPPVGATPVDEGDVGARGSGNRVSILDGWEPVISKHAWVSRHLVQRTSLFVPTRAEDGPDLTRFRMSA